MSIFKESVWETDETGDKLAKELFCGKKKVKPEKKSLVSNNTKNGKKFKEFDGNSKKSQSKDSVEGTDAPTQRNKTNNNKRKSSAIDIDENIIKKWKLESIDGTAKQRKGTKSLKKEFNGKTNKLVDKSSLKSREKTVDDEPVIKKKKKKESKSEGNSDKIKKKKKLNDSNSESDTKTSNVITKSQKRRLKHKEKLLNSKEMSLTSIAEGLANKEVVKGGETNLLNSDVKRSKDSSKMNDKSKLKIDRIQSLLMNKKESILKNNGNITEPKSLRDRMMARLKSSRFRYLNEQMYNNESWSSKKYFKEDPEAFTAYHEGYKLQVEQWPLNPLDSIISSIKRLPKDYIVADFGCGEARLAESVPQKVNSLDLVAVNDKVTACDMAHTTLLTGRIDVVVFCLSLMGTNLTDYLIEANRVLRKDGILKIAEVESRFEDVDEFVKALASYGFINTWKDLSHNLFYFMDFKKENDITKKRNKLPPLELKSCLYKRR